MSSIKKVIENQVPSQHSKLQKGDTKTFHTMDPPTLRATLQNLGPTAIWHPGFVHPCTRI